MQITLDYTVSTSMKHVFGQS